MAVRLLICMLFLVTAAGCFPTTGARTSDDDLSLEAGFVYPPVSARPKALWDWTNGNFSLSAITEELEDARRIGMGGFDIWDIAGWVDPEGVVPAGPPFMSRESVDAIKHAVREATRLDLELGLVISSSWNAGGSWVRPEHGVMALFTSSIDVDGPASFDGVLPFPQLPDAIEGNTALIARDPDSGLPTFYREVAVLAHPLRSDSNMAAGEIVDLTGHLSDDGQLRWNVPEGRWRLARYVCAPTGEPLKRPSPNSNGRMIDHFSAEATQAHLQYFIDRLLPATGTFAGTALGYFYNDSYEANSAAWTPAMPEAFTERNGYEIAPYLPVFDGFTMENADVTARFLFDFRKTLSDLAIENHYRTARELLAPFGLDYYAESGGPGPPVHNVPFEDVKALGAVGVPRGEFWNRHPRLNLLQIIKGPASAAHQYDQPSVEAESFTSVYLWQEGPAELKPLADRAFAEGLSRIVYHTYPHTPPQAGDPGWVYNFGTLMQPALPWWGMSKPFHLYLARVSYLLQQGRFVGDIAYYYGDGAPNFVRPKFIDPDSGFAYTYQLDAPVSFLHRYFGNGHYGHDYDVTNSEVILTRMDAEEGRIVLPHGQAYEMLVLPNERAIRLEVLEKLETLVRRGATVVGPKPERAHGLADRAHRDETVRKIADRMWGDVDSVNVQDRRYGEGRIVWGKPLRQVLAEQGVAPDFRFESAQDSTLLDYIHRRTDTDDIYFVRNVRDRWEAVTAAFRVDGKVPELWDPSTGEMHPIDVYQQTERGIRLPLVLEPFGSSVVVFRSKAPREHVTAMSMDGVEIFPSPPAGVDIRQLPWSDAGGIYVRRQGTYTLRMHGGESSEVTIGELPRTREISGPWEVRFPHGWGAPARTEFPELISWTASQEDGIRHFSGVAAYHKRFDMPDIVSERVLLDLGDVREVAEVWLNGSRIGILWHSPYVVDISEAVRPGENKLVVEVANVLNNRLVGDAGLPAQQRRTKSNITRLPTAWQTPMTEAPLIPSGLLGPVKIRFAARIHAPGPEG